MRIWLVNVGEPLPLPGHTDRLWRTSHVAEILSRRGHEVLWWTSSVDHFRKNFYVEGEPRVPTTSGSGWQMQFLRGRLYTKNVSLRRMVNHVEIARRFAVLARREPRPDVILAAFPTIELAREAVRYAREHQVPVIGDVCDLWPDIFLDAVPRPLRWAARLVLDSQFRDTRQLLKDCDALFAVSERYLDWGLERAGRKRMPDDRVYPLGYAEGLWTDADESLIEGLLRSRDGRTDKLVLTFTGTFGRSADLATPIEAMRLLEARIPGRVQLVLCGSGEREAEWRAVAAGLDSVVFTGWLAAGPLACLLSRSHVGMAAYASTAPQGIPNKIIEYVSTGLAVLSTLDGETRKLLEDNGCGAYYPANDPVQLAALIESWVNDPQRRQAMGAAAKELFESRFAADSIFGAFSDDLVKFGSRPRRSPAVSQAG